MSIVYPFKYSTRNKGGQSLLVKKRVLTIECQL